jgi:uncharacterized protein
MPHKFHMMNLATVPAETSAPPADRIMSGTPEFSAQNFYASADQTKYSGVWEASVGKWAVHYDEWEFCHIIAGSAVITGADTIEWHIKAGDSFVLEPGFSGSWDVREPLRKLYVIFS